MHEENMVDEAMRTFSYIARSAAGEVDLLVALVMLKERVSVEIDAVLDLYNEMGGDDDNE